MRTITNSARRYWKTIAISARHGATATWPRAFSTCTARPIQTTNWSNAPARPCRPNYPLMQPPVLLLAFTCQFSILLSAPESMRIRTQVGLSGTIACASIFCLATVMGWSETNLPSQGNDSTGGERGERSQEILFTPQQLQEQHQQLLKALDLLRRDAAANVQRHAAAVDRIRKDTEASVQRFAAAVDARVDFLGRTLTSSSERELKALQRSNRFVLITAAILVGALLLEILLVAWISVRSVNRLAATLAGSFAAPSPFSGAQVVLQTDAAELAPGDLIRETNVRLQNALDRLERRLLDLDHAASQSSPAHQPSPSSGPRISNFP